MIDGRVDDEVWKTAPRLDDFYVFDLRRRPPDPTWIWVLYDSTNVYFGARCFDSNPELIAIEETKRGGTIGNDDHLSLDLDFSGQLRTEGAWYFKVTAGGVQSEVVPGGSATKQEWRGDWLAAARVDSLGWTAEAAIPLALFRHEGGIDTPRVYVDRWVPRRQEWAAWPNMVDNYDLARTGKLTGIRMPRSHQRPMFMPYLAGEYEDGDYDAYAGVDVKYLSGGLTLLGTANPDNRNIETEVLSLGFSYGERFRSDNRPFFVDGAQYTPGSDIWYSGRVGEMYGGVKAYGAVGRSQIGIVQAFDRENVNHLAGRWYFRPSPRVAFDNSFAWRHSDDTEASIPGMPGTTDNVAGQTSFVGELLRGPVTHTLTLRGGATWNADTIGAGYEGYVAYSRDGGNGGVTTSLTWKWMNADWLPQDGYFDPVLRDLHQFSGSASWSLQTDDPLIRTWSLSTSVGQSVRPDGDVFTRSISASGSVESPEGLKLSGGPSYSERGEFEDHSYSATFAWNVYKLYTSGSISAGMGKVQGTDYRNVSASQGLRFFDDLILSLNGQFYRRIYPVGHTTRPGGGTFDSNQLGATLQYDITPEHSVTGRIIRTDDEGDRWTNAYVSYRQVVRSGVDLYVIVGDPRARGLTKRVALKAMIVL